MLKDSGGKGLPKRTFKDRLTLGKGADQIDLYYFGRGHTNGDAFVVFPSLRVMHTGDMFARKGLPFIDTNNGGSGVEYPNTLSKVHGGVKNVDTVITGHSTQMTMNDVREYSEFLRDFVTAVQTGKKSGQTVDQIAESWKIDAEVRGLCGAGAGAGQDQRAGGVRRNKVGEQDWRRGAVSSQPARGSMEMENGATVIWRIPAG